MRISYYVLIMLLVSSTISTRLLELAIFLLAPCFRYLFVVFDYQVLVENFHLDLLFHNQLLYLSSLSLVAVISPTYFSGQMVVFISAQTFMSMCATTNAFYSTIVEVFLYCGFQSGQISSE